LRAIRAYDPDYVVSLPITLGQYDAVYAGTIDAHVKKLEGDGYDAEAIESTRSQMPSLPLHPEEDEKARKSVVAACSTYRMALGEDADTSKWDERVTSLQPSDSGPFTPVHLIKPEASPRFGAKANLNTRFGLLAASFVGLVDEPTTDSAVVAANDEVAFVYSIASPSGITRIRPGWSCFEQVDTAEGEEPQPAWVDSRTELAWVNDYPYNPVLYVVGNEPEDFCLALLWERLYGQSIWVPDELWVDGASPSSERHRQSLAHGMRNLTRGSSGMDRCILTSISGDSQRVEAFRELIFETPPIVIMRDLSGEPLPDSNSPTEDRVEIMAAESLQFPSRGKHFLGVQRQFHWTDTMPVIRDSEGSVALAASPPAPILDAPGLSQTKISHHIDLDILSVTMPQARALPPAALVRTPESPFGRYDAWVRNGRRGISYESLRSGFVQGGILHQEKLARPRVRKPGMLSWARWKAQMTGYELQVSDAGWPAHILADMCGGRRTLIEAFSGALRPALLEFKKRPSGTGTSDVFDNKNGQKGCVLNCVVYLTLLGFVSLSGQPAAEVRTLVDQLLVSGVLTRGLVLQCSTCRVFSFYPIELVGQSNTCPRCRNVDQFTQELWKVPKGEPDWFYDLHPLGRDLIRDHGDVPLLLAAYLSTRTRNRFSDTPEIVVRQRGKTVAEADLVAVAEDTLLIAEAKSNDILGGTGDGEVASVRLLLKLAEIFGADEIIIATTENNWKEHSLTTIRSEMESYSWPYGMKPKLRVVTSLAPGGKGVEEDP
jgi:hypothetical protein